MKPAKLIRRIAAQANPARRVKRAKVSGRSHNSECEACQ